MSEPAVVNNYSVDIRSIINDYVLRERDAVIGSLVQAGILRNADDGNGFVGVVYVNWEERGAEEHEPQLSLITVGAQPVEEPQDEQDSGIPRNL
jgi:hypothetical protein